MVDFENEICKHLQIPSIPLKEWDGKSTFKVGVAVTNLVQDRQAYAVCTFDADADKEPRITKTFAQEPFFGIEKILVIPPFMDVDDIENADLDEQSKENAKRLAEEAMELSKQNAEEEQIENEVNALPEWVFPEIESLEQAQAWLANYNAKHNIKGNAPRKAESVKLRLLAIHAEMQNKKK